MCTRASTQGWFNRVLHAACALSQPRIQYAALGPACTLPIVQAPEQGQHILPAAHRLDQPYALNAAQGLAWGACCTSPALCVGPGMAWTSPATRAQAGGAQHTVCALLPAPHAMCSARVQPVYQTSSTTACSQQGESATHRQDYVAQRVRSGPWAMRLTTLP